MEIIDINKILNFTEFNKKFIYLISLKDFFLIKEIKNILIKKITKLEEYNNICIKNYYINNNLSLFNILYINYNLDIFSKKFLIIINIEKILSFDEKILKLLNFYNKKNIIIFVLNNTFNFDINCIKKIDIYCIKENYISYNKFVFIIDKIFIKKYKFNSFSIKTYNLLYLMYEDNFIDINKIICYLCINKKKILDNNDINKLSKIYFKNPNYDSWIILSILKYKNLSNFNLLIIKNNKDNDNFIKLLKSLKRSLFFLIFNKLNIKNNNFFIYNFNIKYRNILLKNINKINIKILYKIIKLLYDIDIYIKYFNNKCEIIIWNKLDLILLLLSNISFNYEKNIK